MSSPVLLKSEDNKEDFASSITECGEKDVGRSQRGAKSKRRPIRRNTFKIVRRESTEEEEDAEDSNHLPFLEVELCRRCSSSVDEASVSPPPTRGSSGHNNRHMGSRRASSSCCSWDDADTKVGNIEKIFSLEDGALRGHGEAAAATPATPSSSSAESGGGSSLTTPTVAWVAVLELVVRESQALLGQILGWLRQARSNEAETDAVVELVSKAVAASEKIKDSLCRCAVYELSGEDLDLVESSCRAVVDPSIPFFGLDWPGVFQKCFNVELDLRFMIARTKVSEPELQKVKTETAQLSCQKEEGPEEPAGAVALPLEGMKGEDSDGCAAAEVGHSSSNEGLNLPRLSTCLRALCQLETELELYANAMAKGKLNRERSAVLWAEQTRLANLGRAASSGGKQLQRQKTSLKNTAPNRLPQVRRTFSSPNGLKLNQIKRGGDAGSDFRTPKHTLRLASIDATSSSADRKPKDTFKPKASRLSSIEAAESASGNAGEAQTTPSSAERNGRRSFRGRINRKNSLLRYFTNLFRTSLSSRG